MLNWAKVLRSVGAAGLGVVTVVLFQNCSAGSLPAGLDQASSASVPPVLDAQLVMVPSNTTVASTGTTMITVTGGSGTYTVSADNGATVAQNAILNGWLFTAPSVTVVTQVTVTASDQSTSVTKVITVNPATTINPAPTSQPNVQMYRWYNAGLQKHSTATATGFNEAGSNESASFFLLPDASTGGVPYYRCRLVNVNQTVSFFNSTDQGCEGTGAAWTQIGFIYPPTMSNVANTKPLYRMTWRFFGTAASNLNLDTIDYIDSITPQVTATENPLAPYQQAPNPSGFVPTGP